MSTVKWWVVKRNGEPEPYAPGRVALAVFRAAQAQKPPIPANVSRQLGTRVSLAMSDRLAAGSESRIDVERIQDHVVDILRDLDQGDLSNSYQAYRESRQKDRGRLNVTKKTEKNFRFALPSGKILELDREAWAQALRASLAVGVGTEWNVASWWGAVKDVAAEAKTFDDFIGHHIKILLENANERETWLKTASVLLMERWHVRILGLGPLLHGHADVTKALRLHYKAYWTRRKVEQSAPWFPPVREIDALTKGFDSKHDARLHFSGLSLLESTFGKGTDGLLPQEIFANSALAICYSKNYAQAGEDGRIEDCGRLTKSFSLGLLIPPLNLMRQSKMADPCLSQETHLNMEDSMESIFEALTSAAAAGKSGSAVSVDLSRLRAEAASVGSDGQVSGGVSPVLRLFGEACGMLRGRDGVKQKARLSLACWHRDIESFLAYCKVAPKEMRLSICVPDAFMRRVFEGGDWVLASPSEAIHLSATKGGEFERWVREYAQMAKFGGLGMARCISAREVFGWFCECIAYSGGPSIVFSDACIHYGTPTELAWLTSRMAGVIAKTNQKKVSLLEIGINVNQEFGGVEVVSALMVDTHKILSRVALGDGSALQVAVAPVGQLSVKEFGEILKRAAPQLSAIKEPLPKGSLWGLPNPWEARLKWLEQSRGGYLEHDEGFEDEFPNCSRRSGPVGVVSLSTREEYLWLTGGNPIFVNHDQYRRQVRFEGVRVGFGGSGEYEPLKKQIKRAAAWQKWSDGSLALDVRIDEVSPNEIGEAIKLAWLHGLVGVRRFVGQRVDSVG